MENEVNDNLTGSRSPICGLCKVPYAAHPQCQRCGIYCGPNHSQENVCRYRGKMLCGQCVHDWAKFEKRIGREVPWEVLSNQAGFYGIEGRSIRPWPGTESL